MPTDKTRVCTDCPLAIEQLHLFDNGYDVVGCKQLGQYDYNHGACPIMIQARQTGKYIEPEYLDDPDKIPTGN